MAALLQQAPRSLAWLPVETQNFILGGGCAARRPQRVRGYSAVAWQGAHPTWTEQRPLEEEKRRTKNRAKVLPATTSSAYLIVPIRMPKTVPRLQQRGASGIAAKDLFEDAENEYENARNKVLAMRLPATSSRDPTTVLLELIENGSENQAISFLEQLQATGDVSRVKNDPTFEKYALEQLSSNRQDRFATFLRWFQFAPDYNPQTTDGSKEERLRWHKVDQTFLMHPNQSVQVLRDFVELSAAKGRALLSTAACSHLARTMASDDLQSLWQRVRTSTLQFVPNREEAAHRAEAIRLRAQLDRRHGGLILDRLSVGLVEDAALWLLRSVDPQIGFDAVNLHRRVFRDVLRALDKSRRTQQDVSSQTSGQLRASVWKYFMEIHPAAARQFSIESLVDDTEKETTSYDYRDDGLGWHLIQSLPSLNDARDAIARVVTATGLTLISANTLAGFIARLQAETGEHRAAWNSINSDSLRPLPSRTICRTRWTAAYMQFYLKSGRPTKALAYYSRHCIPFGLSHSIARAIDEKSFSMEAQYDPHYSTTSINDILTRAYLSSRDMPDLALIELWTEFLASSSTHGLSLSAQSFQPFLEAFAASSDLKSQCLQIATTMQARGIEPDVFNWTTILGALASIPEPAVVFQILGKMEGDFQPDISALKPNEAAALEENKGDSFLEPKISDTFSIDNFNYPRPNIVTYTTLIRAFAKQQLPALSRRVSGHLVRNLPAEEVEWHQTNHSRLYRVMQMVRRVERRL